MDNSDLDWPDPYVGLAELYKVGGTNTSSIEPILNKARIATQVYRDKPSLPGSRGEHDVDTPSGRLSPREKHLQVNDEVCVVVIAIHEVLRRLCKTNTILQFRTIDFGMEECSLVLRLPDERLAEADGISYTMSDPLSLNVCAMDVAKLLDVKQVTWRSRPQCSEHITTVGVIPGEEVELSRFPCAWGTFHTFEVSCAEPGCSVDVWSSASAAWGESISIAEPAEPPANPDMID